MNGEKTVLVVDNLYKCYKNADKPALNGLSFAVHEGEIFGFLGPNGAGKTTTIRTLCGQASLNKGQISILGLPLKGNEKKIKHQMGVVSQDITLFPTLTAYENLVVLGGIFGIKYTELKERIDYLLHLFGLTQHKKRKIKEYSGGMKRRINIIAGIIHNPKLLLLDEPTVGIDVQSKNVILDNLRMLNSQGTTIVYTSHYMDEAEAFCSRISIIDEGKIILQGTPKELMAAPPGFANLESLYLNITGKNIRD